MSATTASRAFCHREAAIFFGHAFVECAVRVKNVDNANFRMALPDLVVVRIVGRRDFHAAGAKFRLGPFVGDERNLAAGERQFKHHAALGHVAQLNQLR